MEYGDKHTALSLTVTQKSQRAVARVWVLSGTVSWVCELKHSPFKSGNGTEHN